MSDAFDKPENKHQLRYRGASEHCGWKVVPIQDLCAQDTGVGGWDEQAWAPGTTSGSVALDRSQQEVSAISDGTSTFDAGNSGTFLPLL